MNRYLLLSLSLVLAHPAFAEDLNSSNNIMNNKRGITQAGGDASTAELIAEQEREQENPTVTTKEQLEAIARTSTKPGVEKALRDYSTDGLQIDRNGRYHDTADLRDALVTAGLIKYHKAADGSRTYRVESDASEQVKLATLRLAPQSTTPPSPTTPPVAVSPKPSIVQSGGDGISMENISKMPISKVPDSLVRQGEAQKQYESGGSASTPPSEPLVGDAHDAEIIGKMLPSTISPEQPSIDVTSTSQLEAMAQASSDPGVETAYQAYAKDHDVRNLRNALRAANQITFDKGGDNSGSFMVDPRASEAVKAAAKRVQAQGAPAKPAETAAAVAAATPPKPDKPKDPAATAAKDPAHCFRNGFPQTANKCARITRFKDAGIKLQKSVITLGKRTVDLDKLSCNVVAATKKAKGKHAKKAHASEVASLCNPLEFGLNANGSAICVHGPSSTQGCYNRTMDSHTKQASLDWAKAIREANPSTAKDLDSTETLTCSSKTLEAPPAPKKASRQVADMLASCGVMKKRHADLIAAYPALDNTVTSKPAPATAPAEVPVAPGAQAKAGQ